MVEENMITLKDSFPYKLNTSAISTTQDIVKVLEGMDLVMTEEKYNKSSDIQKYFKLKKK